MTNICPIHLLNKLTEVAFDLLGCDVISYSKRAGVNSTKIQKANACSTRDAVPTFSTVYSIAYALKMEAISTYETLVTT